MTGHVVQLRLQQRPPEAIEADIEAEMARHHDVIRRLMSERAGGPKADPAAELKECKAQAAHSLGMTQQDLTRFLVRYAKNYPDRHKLFIQPAGIKGGRWVVFTDRVKYVRESGEPY